MYAFDDFLNLIAISLLDLKPDNALTIWCFGCIIGPVGAEENFLFGVDKKAPKSIRTLPS